MAEYTSNKPYAYVASDYAGLKTKHAKFYYGYERTYCRECGKFLTCPEECREHGTEWCFVANIGEKEIKIPFSWLGGKDMFACVENLLLGIGWVLAKYRLVLDEGGES